VIGAIGRNGRGVSPKSAKMDICTESRPSGEKAHADIWRHLMTVRTSRQSVTFTEPFSLSGIDEV
jgi:hypothetical protein